MNEELCCNRISQCKLKTINYENKVYSLICIDIQYKDNNEIWRICDDINEY